MSKKDRKYVLLSFDVEEFDIALNYDIQIGNDEQLAVGYRGLQNITKMLARHETVEATFFTTSYFAEHYPETIRKLSFSHEIASHTCSNSIFRKEDLFLSKQNPSISILIYPLTQLLILILHLYSSHH